ncbi:MAG: phosphoglycerate dehydrogenase [Streptosporangiaceae bacterium]
MPAPVVLVAEELSPAGIGLLEAAFEVRYTDGADRSRLLPALGDADAVIVRSATHIDAEAIERAPRLRVIARAGVGLDNVDVDAATKAGVMVVNAPASNVVSAAEHTVALLLALARNLPQAMAALKNGQWKRSAYTGVELQDKVVGILGLGRVGVLVAERLAAFGMTVIAYDPYAPPARSTQLGVRMTSLDEVLAEADFISVHLPKNADTVGLIGDRELHLVKPEMRIVNAARGGIVDEAALARALADGRVAGAALDVYSKEPCTDSPLFGLDNVVVTPHLGASTTEAQEKAGIQVARSVRLALDGEFVPDAVNVQGGVVAEELRLWLPLVEKLGRIFAALAGGATAALAIEAKGEIAGLDVSVLALAAMKGMFGQMTEEPVSYVNAPLVAKERGVEVSLSTDEVSQDWRNLLTLRGTAPDGQLVSVSGTLSGLRQAERIVEVNGLDAEIAPAEHLMVLGYSDRPGVVGTVGRILGSRQVNIAGMQVCRHTQGGDALILLTVDSAVPAEALAEIAAETGAWLARVVDLDGDLIS